LDELALFSSDFPVHVKEHLEIEGEIQAALLLVKDRREGQRVKHIDIIHHLPGIG
jgi:hypothetical protein